MKNAIESADAKRVQQQPIDINTQRQQRKEARPPSFVVIAAGQQEFIGDDGYVYVVALFRPRDKDGNLAAYRTEFGDVPVILRSDPIRVRRHSGILDPPAGQSLAALPPTPQDK